MGLKYLLLARLAGKSDPVKTLNEFLAVAGHRFRDPLADERLRRIAGETVVGLVHLDVLEIDRSALFVEHRPAEGQGQPAVLGQGCVVADSSLHLLALKNLLGYLGDDHQNVIRRFGAVLLEGQQFPAPIGGAAGEADVLVFREECPLPSAGNGPEDLERPHFLGAGYRVANEDAVERLRTVGLLQEHPVGGIGPAVAKFGADDVESDRRRVRYGGHQLVLLHQFPDGRRGDVLSFLPVPEARAVEREGHERAPARP